MSQLFNALERIMTWLEEHLSEHAQSFLPGLNSEQIDKLLLPITTSIPEEIYEIYRWRNGRKTFPPINGVFPDIYDFFPLDEVVETYKHINIPPNEGGFLEEKFSNIRFVPFLGYLDPGTCAYVIGESNNISLIVSFFEAEGPTEYYDSLTSMMLSIAECYERGAYFIVEDQEVDIDGFMTPMIESHSVLGASIIRKYNPLTANKALEDLKLIHSISNHKSDDSISKIISALDVLARYQNPEALEIICDDLFNSRNLYLNQHQMILCKTISMLGEYKSQAALEILLHLKEQEIGYIEQAVYFAIEDLQSN